MYFPMTYKCDIRIFYILVRSRPEFQENFLEPVPCSKAIGQKPIRPHRKRKGSSPNPLKAGPFAERNFKPVYMESMNISPKKHVDAISGCLIPRMWFLSVCGFF